MKFLKTLIKDIETDIGECPECKENVVFVSIVRDYYKCTNCGEEIKQYVNGHIKYLAMTEKESISRQFDSANASIEDRMQEEADKAAKVAEMVVKGPIKRS